MATTNINIQVENEIKTQAQEVFTSLGLDMTTAINMILQQVITQNGFPFVVASNPKKKRLKPGGWEEKIWMSDDFDAPLEDFKEYME